MEPRARVDVLAEANPAASESLPEPSANEEDSASLRQSEIDNAAFWEERMDIRNPNLMLSMVCQLSRVQVAWGQELEEDSPGIALETLDEFAPQGIYEAKLAAKYAALEVVGDALLRRAGCESAMGNDVYLDQAAKVMRMSMSVLEAISRLKESRRQGTVVRTVRSSNKSIGRQSRN